MRRSFIFFVTISFLFIVFAYFSHERLLGVKPSVSPPVLENVQSEPFAVTVGIKKIPVTLAADAVSREQGLSGTHALEKGTGKLFVFEEEGPYGFWMKEMEYAIDMLWFTTEGRLVHIQPHATPETYPTLFTPPEDALYVLEINAGESARAGLQLGDYMTLSQSLQRCLEEHCYIK